ncbi:segregation and condensation protein A [Streptomyces iranensis]|uniref:Segregation and condensation protein A n=1 Tax=Streptomyces iranensis TaxID=576784 RepID=A0A060ZXR8_9ACTN|nr:segregation/condensation protein A [Streptomyces iranensis]MBP2064792.1 segregation and condensation protein A [Streptomyces iranensis]CDR12217.1 chromosome segregation and condensation proteinScpA [Streptomyces iranensis]
MPTNDTPAPPPRPSRRTLGRGPGTAPAGTGPDRSTAPTPPQEAPQRPDPPLAGEAAGEAALEPRNGAQAAPEAPAEPSEPPVASAAPEAVAEPDAPEAVAEPDARETAEARDAAVEPEAREAASEELTAPDAEPEPSPATADAAAAPDAWRGAGGGRGRKDASADEPEPVHARADLDVAPSAGGHGGEAAAAGGGSDEADANGGAAASGGAQAGDGAGASDGTAAIDGGGQGEARAEDGGNRFTVRLDNFEGPFDLLLQLISKHKLDVTEVALSKVTDEFMAHIRAMGPDWDLDQTTEFLVVAATLLDLKAARLLPAAEVEDEADLALLEARDLLFARLLQYRAYKQIADIFNDRLTAEAARHPRTVGLEPHHAELLPDVVISIGPEGFAKLAVKAMQPKPKPQVYVDHIHAPLVSVREQAEVVVARLRELGEATFAALAEDAPDVLTVVARFLALLELYRERAVLLDQPEALGSLMVRWTGEAGERPLVTDEFDQEAKPRKEPEQETATPETAAPETATPEKEKEEVAS